ncbi:MAG: rhodanese-like domain-containing protein [Mycobacterium leprae]
MFGFNRPRLNSITASEVEQRLSGANKPLVVDVREQWEYAEGHIPGSKLKPLNRIQSWAGELKKDDEIVLVCRSGARSASAYEFLQANGFTNLKNMAGGMITWRGAVER